MSSASRPSTIPGRRHKTMFVDFGNPFYRDYLRRSYAEAHRRHLDGIRTNLAGWAADARRQEAAEARAAGRAPRPLAAVLDIDEVVLGNIHMNTFAAPAGEQGPEPVDFHAADYYAGPDGRPWPRGDFRYNPLLPGARPLLEALRALGAHIFFVTGRLESVRAETVENFVHVGLAGGPAPLFSEASLLLRGGGGPLVMCPDAEHPSASGAASVRPYKESRRRTIAATHRILVNVGDQVSDLGLYGDVQAHCPSNIFYYIP